LKPVVACPSHEVNLNSNDQYVIWKNLKAIRVEVVDIGAV